MNKELSATEEIRVEFIGYQDDGMGGAFPLYNAFGGGFNGTTISVGTLVEHGAGIPQTPSFKEWTAAEMWKETERAGLGKF